MPVRIDIYCDNCKKRTPQETSRTPDNRLRLQCLQCGKEKASSSEAKSFVLDGPPGSGKSTVLFGISDGEQQRSSLATMIRRGYSCVHESVAEANQTLAKQGIDFFRNKTLWLRTILEIDLRKYLSLPAGISFLDRCFHHWKLLSKAEGIDLPDWYDALNTEVKYGNPVFLCAPVHSMDLADPSITESRRFTWRQRLDMYEEAKAMYQNLGYTVVEVPMFYEHDIEKNDLARIERILSTLNLPV